MRIVVTQMGKGKEPMDDRQVQSEQARKRARQTEALGSAKKKLNMDEGESPNMPKERKLTDTSMHENVLRGNYPGENIP